MNPLAELIAYHEQQTRELHRYYDAKVAAVAEETQRSVRDSFRCVPWLIAATLLASLASGVAAFYCVQYLVTRQ